MKRLIPILLALCLLPGCGGEAAESTDPPLTENGVVFVGVGIEIIPDVKQFHPLF